MNLLKRLGFYLIGASIGMVFLFYFLKESKSELEFCYAPNCRVLKNIRLKAKAPSKQSALFLQENNIDSLELSKFLTDATVDFSKSNTKLDSCKTYYIKGVLAKKQVFMEIANCRNKAKITTIKKVK